MNAYDTLVINPDGHLRLFHHLCDCHCYVLNVFKSGFFYSKSKAASVVLSSTCTGLTTAKLCA